MLHLHKSIGAIVPIFYPVSFLYETALAHSPKLISKMAHSLREEQGSLLMVWTDSPNLSPMPHKDSFCSSHIIPACCQQSPDR